MPCPRRLTSGCAIMLNLLGEADGDEGVKIAHDVMARAYATPGCKVHWYGKDGMKVGRKVRGGGRGTGTQ